MQPANSNPSTSSTKALEREVDALEQRTNNFKLFFTCDLASNEAWAVKRRSIEAQWQSVRGERPDLFREVEEIVSKFEAEVRPKYAQHHSLLNERDFERAAKYVTEELLTPDVLNLRKKRALLFIEVFEELKKRGVPANFLWS